MKVVIAEKISPAAVDLLKEESKWTVVTPEEAAGKLPEQIADADALIVRSAVPVGRNCLRRRRSCG